MITDIQFSEFLDKLAADVKRPNGLILTDWEAEFLKTYDRLPNHRFHFTDGRRTATDRMWRRYGAELNHPHPLDTVASDKLPAASPEGCEYRVRGDDGRQAPCNEPATKQRQNGFRYCNAHADQVQQEMKRLGKTITLFAIGGFVSNKKALAGEAFPE